MKNLWVVLLWFQTLPASGQQPDSLLLVQLNVQLKKPGDSVVVAYMNRENCNWSCTWLDFDDNEQKTNALAQFLEANPHLKIEIARHTDCRGRDEYNRQYSQKQADQVKSALIKKGIAGHRITARGYGETQPIVACPKCEKCDEEVHWKNSRFVVRLLE